MLRRGFLQLLALAPLAGLSRRFKQAPDPADNYDVLDFGTLTADRTYTLSNCRVAPAPCVDRPELSDETVLVLPRGTEVELIELNGKTYKIYLYAP